MKEKSNKEHPTLAIPYRGPHSVHIDRKPLPHIEHPNDAIIQVTRAAICGSDLHLYNGLVPDTRAGSTFGHEFTVPLEEVTIPMIASP